MVARARANYEITADDRTRQAFDSVQGRLGRLTSQFLSFGRVFALVGGAAGFAALTRGSIAATNQLGDLSSRLGVTVAELDRARFVAEATGVGFNTFSTAVQRLSRRTAESLQGNRSFANAFAQLGINVRAFTQLGLEDRLTVLAEAFSRVEDADTRVLLAQRLLDSEGVILLQTLQGGAAGFQSLLAAATAAGAGLEKGVEDAGKAEKAFSLLGATVRNIGEALGTAFAGEIATATNAIQRFLLPILNVVANAFRQIGEFVGGVAATIGELLRGNFQLAVQLADQLRANLAQSFDERVAQTRREFAEALNPTAVVSGLFRATEEARNRALGEPAPAILSDVENVGKLVSGFRRALDLREKLNRASTQTFGVIEAGNQLAPTRSVADPRVQAFRQSLDKLESSLDSRRLATLLQEIRDGLINTQVVGVIA